jgi:hypothetical protein
MLKKLGPWCWSPWMFQVLIHQGKKMKLFENCLLPSSIWSHYFQAPINQSSHGHLQPLSWTHTPKSLVPQFTYQTSQWFQESDIFTLNYLIIHILVHFNFLKSFGMLQFVKIMIESFWERISC